MYSEIPDASTRHIADQIAHSLSFRKNRLWSRERQCQSENLNFLSHRSAFLLHQYLPTILKIKQNKTWDISLLTEYFIICFLPVVVIYNCVFLLHYVLWTVALQTSSNYPMHKSILVLFLLGFFFTIILEQWENLFSQSITNKRKQMVWYDWILNLLIIKSQVAIIFMVVIAIFIFQFSAIRNY